MTAAHTHAEKRGRWAETLSVIALRLTGWRILARRMKAKKGSGLGEVDIVARRGRTIAFVEVKARADMGHWRRIRHGGAARPHRTQRRSLSPTSTGPGRL